MALTPEQIQQILAGGMGPQNIGGSYYMPVYETGSGTDAEGSGWQQQATGIRQVSGATPKIGEANQFYDLQGNPTVSGTYREGNTGLKGLFNDDFMHIITPLLIAGGVAGAQGAGLIPGGGTTGAAGGAGGFIGEGALSGIPAWDAAGAAGSVGGAGGTAAGLGGASGAATGAAGASGGGGLLASLLPSNMSGLAGIVGPAIGGLLGSKPQQTSQTSTRTIDPRFENAIFGQGGLLGQVQGNLANRATSGIGQRLMNIPVRGNPFSRG